MMDNAMMAVFLSYTDNKVEKIQFFNINTISYYNRSLNKINSLNLVTVLTK